MKIHNVVKANAYFDSVTLMLFSSKLNTIEGVEQAAVMMGTDHNKELMKNSGILTPEFAATVKSNDLVIGIRATTQEVIDQAIKTLDEQFENKTKNVSSEKVSYKTVEAAVKNTADLNFAIVSLPGRFAKAEAMKCLKNGMNVLLFSDNVSIDEENELKDYAVEHQLLLMGPDCGTAIINGVALGFANVVRKGNIGLVAASGTGLQEATVIIDKLGSGISQALGTGGRDVKDAVGGKTMLLALEALSKDTQTNVIGIVSKPPSPSVLNKILKLVSTFDKPIVACFLGASLDVFAGSNIIGCETVEDAAYTLVNISTQQNLKPSDMTADEKEIRSTSGKYLRGLYTGGTLAYESMLILKQQLGSVYSNIASDDKYLLKDPEVSFNHTIVDMGEDYFTDGMPHPMIDPRLRSERIKKEMMDADTAILLLDCVLGYGSHSDPAGALVEAIKEGQRTLDNKHIVMIASVCGTELDPQIRSAQEEKLRQAGVIVTSTNAQAARLAAYVLSQKGA